MSGGTEAFESGTVWGTKNVVAACVRHQVKRLVHISSLSVLDHASHRKNVPVNEASPLEPHPELRGAYSQTKLVAEKVVLDAIRNQDLPAVILRPGQIFGPGSGKAAPSGVIAIAGRWIVMGSGALPLNLVISKIWSTQSCWRDLKRTCAVKSSRWWTPKPYRSARTSMPPGDIIPARRELRTFRKRSSMRARGE